MNRIERGLGSADFVAFFLSEAPLGANRGVKSSTWRYFSRHRWAIVLPILLDDAEAPVLLREVMHLDMRAGDIESGIAALVAAIKRPQLERLHTFLKRA